jgi:hypothetical protein
VKILVHHTPVKTPVKTPLQTPVMGTGKGEKTIDRKSDR